MLFWDHTWAKTGPAWATPKIKLNFFCGNNMWKEIISFQELFILSKYHKVWLSYEWFSVTGCLVWYFATISGCVCMTFSLHFKRWKNTQPHTAFVTSPFSTRNTAGHNFQLGVTWTANSFFKKTWFWDKK